MESMYNRIRRHVLKGEIGPQTIKRGLSAFTEWAKSYDILESTLVPTEVDLNCISITGLNKYAYTYMGHEGQRKYGGLDVIEFPKNSHLEVDVCEDKPVEAPIYLAKRDGAIAEFVGPTTDYESKVNSRLPNNGFYYKGDEKHLVPFMDTNPSWKEGIRRGAVMIDKRGVTHILTDAQKWDIVNSNYANCDVMFGTSTYFTGTDSLVDEQQFKELDRDRVSYLIQYVDQNGDKRFCYVHISAYIPRMIAKVSIDQHMQRIKAKSYIAGELELLGAGCSAKIGKHVEKLTRIPPMVERIDHYLIVPGAEGKSTIPPTRSRT